VEHPDFIPRTRHPFPTDLAQANATVFGPGVGVTATSLKFLKRLYALNVPVVLDADGLSMLAKTPRTLPSNWILTPHEAEMGRLIGEPSAWVAKNRVQAVRRAQKRYSCVVLLKGHGTLVCSARHLWRVDAGNPALAKAGTGDVLSGILGALIAQGLSSEEAACLGAYLHGSLADRWVQSHRDELSLLASDLVDQLPEGLAALRR
jgi:NAD(P)H-hydrate epimerase